MFGLVSWFRSILGRGDALGAPTSGIPSAAAEACMLDVHASRTIVPSLPTDAWMPKPVRDRMEWDGDPQRWRFRRAVGYALGGRLYDEAYALLRLDLAEARALTPRDEQFRLLEILVTSSAIAFKVGDSSTAERLARESIAIAEAVGLEANADRADALVRLGEVVSAHGDRVTAKRIFEDALEAREASLGRIHEHSRGLRDFIANFSIDTPVESRKASAIAQIEAELLRGYSISRDIAREEVIRDAFNFAFGELGGSHVLTGRACAALAEILDFRACLQEAREFWFHHCDIAMLHHGPESVEVQQALAAIAANQLAIAQGADRGCSKSMLPMTIRADEHLHAWLLGRLAAPV